MREFARNVIASLVASALFTGILYLAGANPSPETLIGQVLGNPLYRYGLIGLVAFFISFASIRYIRKRRQDLIEDNAPVAYSRKRKPKKPMYTDELQKFGVVWRGFCGSPYPMPDWDEAYTYVEGPFCPNDGTELATRKVRQYRVLTRRVWKCPDCGSDYARPKAHLFNERKSVEKVIDNEFRKSLDEYE